MIKTNRIIWMIVFLTGTVYMGILEWQSETSLSVGWFLFSGLWSAFCGICFTVLDWLAGYRNMDS